MEYFEDDFRTVARFKTTYPKEHKKEFVTVVSDVDGYEYVEFERLSGHAKVYLNGTNEVGVVGDDYVVVVDIKKS